MELPVRTPMRWKQVGASAAMVLGSVFATTVACDPVVTASTETIYKTYEILGPTSSFAGDTLEVYVSATDQKDVPVRNTKPAFTVSNAGVKLVGLVGLSGHSMLVELVAPGTSVVSATAAVGRLASGGTPVATRTISVVGKPAKIVIFNAPHTLDVGQQRKVWAQVQDAQGRKIESAKIAVERVTTPAGLITESVNLDTVTITAVAPGTVTMRISLTPLSMTRVGLTGPPISAEISVNIIGKLSDILFTPTNHTLTVGQSATVSMLSVDGAQNVLTGATYQVTSLTPNLVSVSNVTGSGFTVNALSSGDQPQGAGKVSVTATRGDTLVTRVFDVAVNSRVASVSVQPSAFRVEVGTQQPLVPTVTLRPGAPQTPAPVITWESANTSKVTVNAQGIVTGVENTGTSRVFVTAIVEGVRFPVEVQVGPYGMGFVPASVTMSVGSSRTLSLEERDSSGVARPGVVVPNNVVDWSSSTVVVATVDAAGVVSCHMPGVSTISARLKNAALTAGTMVTCGNAAPVASIILDPVEFTALAGSNVQFKARLFDAEGNETNAASGFHVEYTVTTSAIAELVGPATNGVVLAKAPGTTTINALYRPIAGGTPSFNAQATLRVGSTTPGQPATVQITQTHLLASPGVSQGLTAVAYDANGNVVPGATFLWSKLVGSASVNVNANTGVVTTVSTGGNTIFASVVLPGEEVGATGVTAVTTRTAGAVQATVHTSSGTPATSATVRAWIGGTAMVSGIVPVNSASPGRAYVPGLLAGTYTITISAPGHQVRRFENVVIPAQQIVVLNGGNPIVLLPQ